MFPGGAPFHTASHLNPRTVSPANLQYMPETPPETKSNRRPPDDFLSDEARLLDLISQQLAGLQETLNRLERRADQAAGEFLPALRHLLGRRAARAAASASSMFRGRPGP